jgi:hypothetical protein
MTNQECRTAATKFKSTDRLALKINLSLAFHRNTFPQLDALGIGLQNRNLEAHFFDVPAKTKSTFFGTFRALSLLVLSANQLVLQQESKDP